MSVTSFDDFNNGDESKEVQEPLFSIDHKNGSTLFDWLKLELDRRLSSAESRMRYYRLNLALYKGKHYKDLSSRNNDNYETTDDMRKPKVVYNWIQEMVDSRVSKLAETRPSLIVIPMSNEWQDRTNAKTIEKLVKSRYDQVDIEDSVYSEADFVSFLMGTSYAEILWNKDIGDRHPAYDAALAADPEAKLANGKKIKDTEIKIGDVDFAVRGADVCLPELRKKRWNEVNDFMYLEWKNIEEVKKDYPKLANKISASEDYFKYENETLEVRKMSDETLVVHYYHRKMKHLPNGKEIIFTPDVILENKDLSYDHGKIPYIPLRDIEVPDELHGRSFIQNIVQLQRHFNNISSGIARNHGLASMPKWMVPKGSCSISNLNNEFSVCEYTGPIAPQIAKFNPTPPELFMYQDKLENYIEKLSMISATYRGEPPPGISSGVALQFLDEKDQKRESRNILKKYTFIRNVFKMTTEVMKQYYKEGDGRTIRILGEDNEYMIKQFKDVDFNVMYDVRVQNASALPDSKAGRMQAIIDLNNSTNTSEDGPVFSREEIISMLDLGLDEAFKEGSTVSVKVAYSVIDSILKGEEYPEPQEYDDFLVQYPIFLRTLQSRTFKEKIPSENQIKFIEYMTTMEGLMWIRSQKNPMFAQQLMMKNDYPLFFEVPIPPVPQVMPGEGMVEKSTEINVNPESLSGQELNK